MAVMWKTFFSAQLVSYSDDKKLTEVNPSS